MGPFFAAKCKVVSFVSSLSLMSALFSIKVHGLSGRGNRRVMGEGCMENLLHGTFLGMFNRTQNPAGELRAL